MLAEVKNYLNNKTLYSKFYVHRAMHRNVIFIVKPTRYTNVSNLFYLFYFIDTRWNQFHLLPASKQTAVSF